MSQENERILMEYLIGVVLAAVVFVFAAVSGFDRERVFYSTVLVVVGHYYILFAAMGGSTPVLVQESLAAAVFLALSVIGFRKSLWLTAAALAGHGIFDFFHHLLIQNPGVPVWWHGFCMSFDVLAGGLLAVLLMRRAGFAAPI
jgi:hypothetical protein